MLFGASDLLTCVIVCISVLFGLGNIIVLTGLIYVYWGSFKEIKSEFTIGLLLFAATLLLQNILLVITYFMALTNNWYEGVPALLFILFQFIALSILLKISWE